MAVTKEFIQALRLAERVVIRIKDKQATVELIKNDSQKASWVQQESRIEFTFPARIDVPGFSRATFATMWKDSSNYQALQYLLKAGDELRFIADDNCNQYLEKAEILPGAFEGESHPHYKGIHGDELYCQIKRNRKDIISRFVLADSHCPDNSARPFRF